MFLGIDIGSLAAKAVVVDDQGEIIGRAIMDSGHDHRLAAELVAEEALKACGADRGSIRGIVGTGYGRVSIPFATRTVTEISCHARGAAHASPGSRMVVDIGGQDSKVILIDDRGRVVDFGMNDRCAAGTGRFLEVMARSLGVPLKDLGEMALSASHPARISSVCTVFAESEVVGLIAAGEDRSNIIRGLCQAIAERIHGMVGRVGLARPVIMTGGVALNRGVVAALEEKLGVAVVVPPDPQTVGALGAALLAREGATKDAG